MPKHFQGTDIDWSESCEAKIHSLLNDKNPDDSPKFTSGEDDEFVSHSTYIAQSSVFIEKISAGKSWAL